MSRHALSLLLLAAACSSAANYDIIIVGGGMSGMSVALAAVERNLTVLVLEQGTVSANCKLSSHPPNPPLSRRRPPSQVCGQGATAAAKQGQVRATPPRTRTCNPQAGNSNGGPGHALGSSARTRNPRLVCTAPS